MIVSGKKTHQVLTNIPILHILWLRQARAEFTALYSVIFTWADD